MNESLKNAHTIITNCVISIARIRLKLNIIFVFSSDEIEALYLKTEISYSKS